MKQLILWIEGQILDRGHRDARNMERLEIEADCEGEGESSDASEKI